MKHVVDLIKYHVGKYNKRNSVIECAWIDMPMQQQQELIGYIDVSNLEKKT